MPNNFLAITANNWNPTRPNVQKERWINFIIFLSLLNEQIHLCLFANEMSIMDQQTHNASCRFSDRKFETPKKSIPDSNGQPQTVDKVWKQFN